jgi:hypothetical protein
MWYILSDKMNENTSLNSLYSQLYSAFKEAFPKSKGFNG